MEKIVNKLIDEFIKGVDTYTHNGSTWLIFTESKQWVIELTEEKTLWYNYNFFSGMFSYVSMDVVENQQYITKWVEDNIIGGVKELYDYKGLRPDVKDTIQNGVKETSGNVMIFQSMKVEDAIKNGVKETFDFMEQNINEYEIDDTIKNGVKHTEKSLQIDGSCVIEDTIQNGVRDISPMTQYTDWQVEEIIENGVKETELHKGVRPNAVGEAIQNGVKETMFNQGKKPLTVKNIIENGVRHTLNTEYMPTSMVEDIIQSGVKETKGHGFEQQNIIDDIVKDGVKETKTPGNGDIRSTIEWMEENKYNSYTKMIDDVIDNGVKEIKTPNKDGDIQSTLEWMYKNNYQDDYNGSKMINNVIENGIKEVQPLPEQSGELIGYGNYYKLKEDRTKPFIDYLEDTIKFGVKES